MTADESLRCRMRELAGLFLVRTQGEAAQIYSMINRCSGNRIELESVLMLAHKISGTASTFQFDDISAYACQLEETAMALSGDPAPGSQSLQKLSSLAVKLSDAVEHSLKAAGSGAEI